MAKSEVQSLEGAEIHAALIFQLLNCFSHAQLNTLLQVTGSFAEALYFVQQPPGEDFVLSAQQQQQLNSLVGNSSRWQDRAVALERELAEQQAQIIPLTSTGYPDLLKALSTPPPIIFVQGNATLLHLPQIAIVGSRRGSRGGLQHAEQFARALAASGIVISSGMALGIDGAAHHGALQSGSGKTLAVLGTGLDVLYPKKHAQLREQILAEGGALVSEFLPGTPAVARHFPRRNRIISGLSMGVLVVEAAIKSGSLITARYALSQGREVFAIPGSIHNPLSRGCHQLLREGAVLVESVQDIIDQLGGFLSLKHDELEGNKVEGDGGITDPVQQILLDAMGYDPIGIDQLIEQSDLSAAEVNSGLLSLELSGLIVNQHGRISRLQ